MSQEMHRMHTATEIAASMVELYHNRKPTRTGPGTIGVMNGDGSYSVLMDGMANPIMGAWPTSNWPLVNGTRVTVAEYGPSAVITGLIQYAGRYNVQIGQ